MTNFDTDRYYTMYVVRDANKRSFLNRPTYSGRIRGVWGLMGEAHLFSSEAQAQSCASNISRREPGCRAPEVRPVMIRRRKTLRSRTVA